jgi:hypothetical protein
MGHKHDYWERLRGWLIPKLGIFAQFLEDVTGDRYYVESKTHNNQFVGRVDMGEEEFEKELHDMGFERNPLAAWKHIDTGENEEGSFRKVGYENHPDMQLHVILYDGDKMAECGECVYVYAHWELRWDVDPIGHYRGGGEWNPAEGVRRMKDLLDQNGIEYTLERPPQ